MQNKPKAVYDTATVARVLSAALGKSFTPADVRNLARRGAALHRAIVRNGTRGTYNPNIVGIVAGKMTRRRLAAELGRTSPRFLDASHSRKCLQCQGVAVEWGGQVKCEAGHTYVEAVDPGSRDETAVVVFEDGQITEEHHYPARSEDEERLQNPADHG